jgi:predicted HTH transcriptional regulator
MTRTRSSESLIGLVRELLKQPKEAEWVEFKLNNDDAQEIGEYISALANSAALEEKAFAYVLWGIENNTRTIVGTQFDPTIAKRGNEELESWLLRLLSPRIDFRFFEAALSEGRVVVLEIARAFPHPVKFSGEEYIRVGSYKKKLKEFPEKERTLWRLLDKTPFEKGIAAERVSDEDVVRLLDVPAYFRLAGAPPPASTANALEALAVEELIRRGDHGRWDITNLGAILFATTLGEFRGLRRKAMRVVAYKGNDRVAAEREKEGSKGYASGFEGLIGYVNNLVPTNEVIQQALRRTVPMYPELAVRELVANAIIHQDFAVTGAGPMVEIFKNRMEITNPGEPLVPPDRFVDSPPKSRNEALASLMRRFGVCEERGSGIDKVVFETEFHQLPAPLFEVPEGFTRVVLFAHRPLSEMDKIEKRRACYLHACLRWVQGKQLTNASLRERFGIEKKNSAIASRLIADAVDAKRIVPMDPNAAPKEMRYVPWWAADREEEP